MGSASALAAFMALWRAYGEGRLDRSLDLVDPDCELIRPGEPGPRRGREAVRDWLAEARRDWRTVTVTYDDVREPQPGCVVATGRVAATSADGTRQVERPLRCVAEFRDGRLVRAEVCGDPPGTPRFARGARSRPAG